MAERDYFRRSTKTILGLGDVCTRPKPGDGDLFPDDTRVILGLGDVPVLPAGDSPASGFYNCCLHSDASPMKAGGVGFETPGVL